jgi:hypothetical protein
MLRVARVFACFLTVLFVCGLMSPMAAQSVNSSKQVASDSYLDDPANWLQQFVPDSQLFWDNSAHWTTNYGPAYRDTLTKRSEFLACSPQFALCFHSGQYPLPCHLAPDGRSANCKCLVLNETNYVLLTAILNRPVYLDTVEACGTDGSLCGGTDQAPVCNYLKGGALIPGADVISTYDPGAHQDLVDALQGKNPVTVCSPPPARLPFAGCMTAPCKLNSDGSTAQCKCPVFYGTFQLVGKNAQCSLGGDLVPSASYIPKLDTSPPK